MRHSICRVFCLFCWVLLVSACATTSAPVRDGHASPAENTDEKAASGAENAPRMVPPQGNFIPDLSLSVCPIRVRNAPPNDASGQIPGYGQLFVVDRAVALATVPLNGGCLSSGYGLRNERLHKGIDISAPRGTWVYSAGPGIVREAGWGGAYGYYVLIEHDFSVFTRYAHLDGFVEGLEVGSELGFGWPIGQVGNSSTQSIGVHLHYEILTGDYHTSKKSFGLDGNDPFSFPVYIAPSNS